MKSKGFLSTSHRRALTTCAAILFVAIFAAHRWPAGASIDIRNANLEGRAGVPSNGDGSGDGERLWEFIDERSIEAESAERKIIPSSYSVVRLEQDRMRIALDQAPSESNRDFFGHKKILTLPMPDGTLSRFSIFESSILEPGLMAKFPDIRTYAGQGIDDPASLARIDFTPQGFHAIVLRPEGSVYVDPYAQGNTENYISYAKKDARNAGGRFSCLVDEPEIDASKFSSLVQRPDQPDVVVNAGTLRTYRLAMAATGEYTTFHGGTVPLAMAAIVTSMNRVNAIYERDLGVRMILVANNNLIVYTDGTTDPYTNNNGTTMLGQNQTNLDAVIGTANYDVGHVFSTGGGGVATLNAPCNPGTKARGVTGRSAPVGDPFDVDYVAHEIGHQFGGSHTFNGNGGSCGGNRSASNAYEPGSGSTIMAYAGICGADNLQPNSDDAFHVRSLEQMVAFITNNSTGGSCDVETPTLNSAPAAVAAPACVVPPQTAFTLNGAGSDVDGDSLTYNWEQYDLGSQQALSGSDNGSSPIFRSFNSTTGTSRTFPRLSSILNNTLVAGEKYPVVNRTMNFQMTVRDNRAAGGGVRSVQSTVQVAGNAPFAVTQPNTSVSYPAGTVQPVTWDVSNTTAAPVSCSTVDILMSTDGGLTFPATLAVGTANDGTQSVTIPNTLSTTARMKVQCSTSCFFDISNANFTVTAGPGPVPPSASASAANVTTAGATAHPITVTYTDNTGINVSTLDGADFNVSGPNAFGATGSFIQVDNNTNGTPRVATYSLLPPGGSWDASDNGTYTIGMQVNQVADVDGLFVPSGPVGSFTVNIATPTPTATATVLPTPTATATVAPTPTATATVAPTPTPTATATVAPTPVVSPTPPGGVISIQNVSLAEGNFGTTSFEFDVTLTPVSPGGNLVTVDFSTVSGSASAGSDYTPVSGTLTFTSQSPALQRVTVNVNGDAIVEPDETFSVVLSNLQGNAVFNSAMATGTIFNDDAAASPVPSPTPARIEGDIVDGSGGPGGDGLVLSNDVAAIRQFVLGAATPANQFQFQSADVNLTGGVPCGNGILDSGDVTVIRQMVLGNVNNGSPPCGPTGIAIP